MARISYWRPLNIPNLVCKPELSFCVHVLQGHSKIPYAACSAADQHLGSIPYKLLV
jgi:hypothetical protein